MMLFLLQPLMDSFDGVAAMLLLPILLSKRITVLNMYIPICVTALSSMAFIYLLPKGYGPNDLFFFYFAGSAVLAVQAFPLIRKNRLWMDWICSAYTVFILGMTLWLETRLPDVMVSRIGIGLMLSSLLLQSQWWRWLPLHSPSDCLRFFSILLGGWLMLRISLWVFFYAQLWMDSPLIRFQIAEPQIISERAVAWNFPRLQAAVDQSQKPRTLHTETRFSEKQITLLTQGLEQAEAFRVSLLEPSTSGKPRSQAMAESFLQFKEQTQAHLTRLTDRPDLERFDLNQQELIEKIEGRAGRMYGTAAFDFFDGNWYGLWDQNPVDHQWDPSDEFIPSLSIPTHPALCIRALQYAWIGDGFGWNAVIAPECKNSGDVILGTVYHVRNQDPDNIYLHRPHVGIALDETQLIWFTRGEVFLEETLPGQHPSQDRYAITGFFYEIQDGKLKNRDAGFQAVYTRQPDHRPEWIRYPIEISIDL